MLESVFLSSLLTLSSNFDATASAIFFDVDLSFFAFAAGFSLSNYSTAAEM